MNRKTRQEAQQAARTEEELLEQAHEAEASEGDQHPTVQELESRLTEAEQKRDEYLNMAQRVQADFDNFRRRNQSVRAESFEDGAASFIKTILPVMDNLDRALQVESKDEALHNGVQLVQKQLMEALEKRGVSVIDRQGEIFDPKLEDAVQQASRDEGEVGTVAQVLLKGYQMGENVLRHAMVKVIVG